jgi:hypothetical protein
VDSLGVAVKRFRGFVGNSPIWKGTYTDVVSLSPSTIEFRPFLRKNVKVSKGEVAPIELIIDRSPVLWTTEFRFRNRADSSIIKVFRPARYKRFLGALYDWDWPLDAPPVKAANSGSGS